MSTIYWQSRFQPLTLPVGTYPMPSEAWDGEMHVFARLVPVLILLGCASAAQAADQPVYGPIPGWVKPIPIPDAPARAEGATQLLLEDHQVLFGDDMDQTYAEIAVKVVSPQGLLALGSIGDVWNPDTDTVIVHHLRIIRDGRDRDLLAGGKKLTVLRRETSLELAMLDGTLTATLQPEDLRVGDVLDMAFTRQHHDPAMEGRSEGFDVLAHTGLAARVHFRQLWPSTKPMRWRATEGLGKPTLSRTASGSELTFDLTDVATPKPPLKAPVRFRNLGQLTTTQFADWAEVAALMAPLYAKASALAPDSPLKVEVAKIKLAAHTPTSRALAALQLVEQQTRYLALSMHFGGYVPAAADLTWTRRFGDCKGKTALLLALLRELGVKAQPALVSTALGDGLNERLPMVEYFDHVIVRAVIDGKVFWLDGTRQGDRDLEALPVPNYHWALPVQDVGAVLEALSPKPLIDPGTEEVVRLDASAGIDKPAPAHLEYLYRGDEAVGMRLVLGRLTQSDTDRYLREFWKQWYPWISATKVDARDDIAAGLVRLTLDGAAAMDWSKNGAARFFEIGESNLGFNTSFDREPGPNADAPYAVDFPSFQKWTVTIVLPTDGGGFRLSGGPDIDRTIGAIAYHRVSRIDNGRVVMEATQHSLAPEFPFAEGTSVAKALRELARLDVDVETDPVGAPEAATAVGLDEVPVGGAAPVDAAGFSARGSQYLRRDDYAHALADFDQAARLEPKVAKHVYNRGVARYESGQDARALDDFNQALALDPVDVLALLARAEILLRKGDESAARKDFDKAEALSPNDQNLLWRRGQAYFSAGRLPQAIETFDKWLARFPERSGRYRVLAGRCIAKSAKADGREAAMSDCDAALALNPGWNPAHLARGSLYMSRHDWARALEDFDAVLASEPKSAEALYARGEARAAAGSKADGAADIAAALAIDPKVVGAPGNYGLRP